MARRKRRSFAFRFAIVFIIGIVLFASVGVITGVFIYDKFFGSELVLKNIAVKVLFVLAVLIYAWFSIKMLGQQRAGKMRGFFG